MNPRLAIIVTTAALAGCGGRAAPVAPGNTPAAASGRERIACPAEAELQDLAHQAFGARGGTVTVTCVALYHDGPRWYLSGWHEPDEDLGGIAQLTALIDAGTRAALWTSGVGDYDLPPGAIDHLMADDYTAADLDADGKDELLSVTAYNHQGYESATLAVLAITPTGVEERGSVPYSEDNGAADVEPGEQVSCGSELTLVGGPDGTKQIALTVTSTGAIDGECLKPGRHVLRWDGKALVETP